MTVLDHRFARGLAKKDLVETLNVAVPVDAKDMKNVRTEFVLFRDVTIQKIAKVLISVVAKNFVWQAYARKTRIAKAI